MEVLEKEGCLVVRYRRRRGGKRREFALELPYVNDARIRLVLVAEEQDRALRPLEARVDLGETEAPAELVARDLAEIRWYVFPRERRDYVLPPVIALWEKGSFVVAACLPARYGAGLLPWQEQERGSRDPARGLCWWPDPKVWDAPCGRYGSQTVSFFPFSEWLKKPGVWVALESAAECKCGGDPQCHAERVAGLAADAYAGYLRSLRTALLRCHRENVPVRVALGSAERARRFLAEENLDPEDPASWARAASCFDEMPDFVPEVAWACGPLGVLVSGQKLKACISRVGCLPGYPQDPDLVGAAVFAGAQPLLDLACWLNPLRPEAEKVAREALLAELERRGVEEVVFIEEPLPFQVSPDSGNLAFFFPEVPRPERRVLPEDPCPCGSGLKHRDCCGRG